MNQITLPQEGTRIGGIPFSKRYNCQVWQYIIYPDSAPENWRDNLIELGLKFAVSPLHDKDINPDGNPKKPHYHALIVWKNPTTWQNAIRIAEGLNNSVVPMPALDVRNRYDYFTHKNDLDPDKFKYDESEIEHHNGFVLSEVAKLNSSEVGNLMLEITNICRELTITEYSDLIFYLIDNQMFDALDVAQHHTIYFTALLKGIWRTTTRAEFNESKYTIDVRTGEIIKKSDLPTDLQQDTNTENDSN